MQELQRATNTIDPRQVTGWGVDADPENDPTYPMKSHTGDEHEGYTWDRPEQQPIDVEVLHSNERPNVSAAFGTTLPPSGISGMIRRAAFNFSENSYGHWLPLMLADRVDMIEGVADDLMRGHIPNIFSEMGMKAEWKHNRKAVITKAAVGAGLLLGAFALIRGLQSKDSES